MGVLFFLNPGASSAQELSQVTLEVQPTTVRVALDAEGQIVGVLSNGSDGTLIDVTVTTIVPAGLTIEPTGAGFPNEVPPNASVAGEFLVRRTASAAVPATGLLRVEFQRRAGDGVLIPQTLIQSFEIEAREPTPADRVATVELKASGVVLDEFGGIDLVAVITNTSAVPITIAAITPRAPSPIEIATEGAAAELAPGEQRAVRFHVSVPRGAAIRSGENLIVVEVDIEWGASASRETLSLVATQTIKLGVFAESDIAELAKIPSLLFLPGFMLLMAIVLSVRLPWVRLAGVGDRVTSSPAIFAFLMVPASLITLTAYWVWAGRDLRLGYSFTDVLYVSVLGIFLGVVIVLVGQLIRLRWLAWSRLNQKDDELTTLQKLGRQHQGLRLKRVAIKGAAGSGLLYEEPREGSTVAIIGPPILLDYQNGDADLENRINRYRNEATDPGGLAEVLKRETGRVAARWNPAPGSKIEGLMSIDRGRLEVSDTEAEVVQG